MEPSFALTSRLASRRPILSRSDPILRPDLSTMTTFLDAYTRTSKLQGLLELAWTRPNDGGIASAKRFRISARGEMAELAFDLNQERRNVYFGAALRLEGMKREGRSKKKHVEFAVSVWADFDEPGTLDDALVRLQAAGAPPNFVTITGEHPHRRGHVYFQLAERTYDLERVTRLNRALATPFNGDHVFNIDRLMRFPASVAWPIPGKPDRVPEVTHLVHQGTRDERYSIDELEALLSAFAPTVPDTQKRAAAVPVQSADDRAIAWARAALNEEVSLVATAVPTTRNITLIRGAYKIGQLVGAGFLDRQEAEVALLAAGLSSGLTRSECVARISRQLSEGERNPRYPDLSSTGVDARADGLPAGYDLRDDGIYIRTTKDGEEQWIKFCSPFRAVVQTRNHEGEGWGTRLEVRDPDGREHAVTIPAALLASDGAKVRSILLGLGLRLEKSNRASGDALVDLVNGWRPSARAETTDRLGWSDSTCSAFVFGDGTVFGADDVVYQPDPRPDVAKAMRSKGTLADWREHVGKPCHGNPMLMMAVASAFASVLLEPLGLDGGGLHFRGKSSKGKTTLLLTAASIWAAPEFVQSWRATLNALEDIAAACNGTVLLLDELNLADPREAAQAAYALANGQEKARAHRTGDAKRRKNWKLIFLSSGEAGLAELLQEANQRTRAGQEVRLIEIHAARQKFGVFDDLHSHDGGHAFSMALSRNAKEYYGTAGPEFVRGFLEGRDAHVAWARNFIKLFPESALGKRWAQADGQVKRAAARLAVIAAGGELATIMGITGWKAGAATKAVQYALRLWIKQRGGTSASEDRAAITRTRDFLLQHRARFAHSRSADTIRDRAGWLVKDHFYVIPAIWQQIHRGHDAEQAARDLSAASLLRRGDGRHLKRKTPQVEGSPRCYCIPVQILDGDAEAGN
jgi:putative DNA primase/helicase